MSNDIAMPVRTLTAGSVGYLGETAGAFKPSDQPKNPPQTQKVKRDNNIASAVTSVSLYITFALAPNKLSPNDKVWQEIERFLAVWDASGESTTMNGDWLHELRAGWDRRLDNLYGGLDSGE